MTIPATGDGVSGVSASAEGLRERLIAAKISGARTARGYEFRTNQHAAEVAASVVAQWLYSEAQAHQEWGESVRERVELGDSSRTEMMWRLLDQAEILRTLAHSVEVDRG